VTDYVNETKSKRGCIFGVNINLLAF